MSVVAAFVLQATLVKAVQDVRDGRADLSISQTVSAALPFLAPVAGASILAGIAITIGLLLLIVPGLFLITIWAVIVPVIVIERSGALASFGRSRELVRGHGWHVFGTLVLVYIIMLVANIVLGLIFSALPHVLGERPELDHLGHPDLPVPRPRRHARVLPAGRQPRRPAGGGPYGGYQQPPAATAGTPSRRRAAASRTAAGTSRHLRAAEPSHRRAVTSRTPGGWTPAPAGRFRTTHAAGSPVGRSRAATLSVRRP